MKKLKTLFLLSVILNVFSLPPEATGMTIDFGPSFGAPTTGHTILIDQLEAQWGVTFSTINPEGVIWYGGDYLWAPGRYSILSGEVGGVSDNFGVDPIRVDFSPYVTNVSIEGFNGATGPCNGQIADYDTVFLQAFDSEGSSVDSNSVTVETICGYSSAIASVSSSEIAYVTFHVEVEGYQSGEGHGLWFDNLSYSYTSNHSPVADAGPDQTVDADAACTATVILDGSDSIDPDSTPTTNDDIVSFEWYKGGNLLGSGEILTHPFSLGEYTVMLVVTDSFGTTDEDEVIITVQDTAPPGIGVSVDPAILWPPNHKMVPVVLEVNATDTCELEPVCQITSVTSNESVNGWGAGNTASDWEITGNLTASLRAERSGKGAGRQYTITVECTDGSGNSSIATKKVIVPHDKGKKKGKK
jgi:hypothetical protein